MKLSDGNFCTIVSTSDFVWNIFYIKLQKNHQLFLVASWQTFISTHESFLCLFLLIGGWLIWNYLWTGLLAGYVNCCINKFWEPLRIVTQWKLLVLYQFQQECWRPSHESCLQTWQPHQAHTFYIYKKFYLTS